jgi:predicted Zn finger-like uncharacterized protein
MFKVVADQLKVSDGWVRCGHCDGVFDASAHFQAIDEAEPLPVPEPDDQGAPPAAALPMASADDSPKDFIAQINPPARPQAPVAAPVAEPVALPSQVDDASISASLSSYLSAPESSDATRQEAQARSQEGADRRALYGSTPSNKPLNSPTAEETRRQPPQEVAFVQAAQRRDKAKSPLYQVLAVLLTLALLGGLAVQVLVHERDALAARLPAVLPALEVLCQTMDCQINPPRVIEAVMIDSSSFTQTGPGAYRLNVVLKNNRTAVVAMPALEVTLTGSQNEVLIRKVLLPADIGATSNRLAQATPFAGVFNLQVSLPPQAVAPMPAAPAADVATPDGQPVAELPAEPALVTGYRLFAFYP